MEVSRNTLARVSDGTASGKVPRERTKACLTPRHPQGIESPRIDRVNRIGRGVRIAVSVPAAEKERILTQPPTCFGIVISRAKAAQLRVGVVKAAGKPERLQSGRATRVRGRRRENVAERVIVQL